MLARKGPLLKRTDKNAALPMRRQEEIVKMLEGGEQVVKYQLGMNRHPHYAEGVVAALKWVLRVGESPMR